MEENEYSPLSAAVSGRDQAGRDEILDKLVALPDSIREILTSPDTSKLVASWEQTGLFPPNYRTAILKSLTLTVLGDIKPEVLGTLLQRIGLGAPQAEETANRIRAFAEPLIHLPEPETPEVALDPEAGETDELREIPPLTTTQVPGAPPSEQAPPQETVPNTETRNIIDLRKSS